MRTCAHLIVAAFSLVQAARSAGKVQQDGAAFEDTADEQSAAKCTSIMSNYLCKEGSNPADKDKACIVKLCNDGNDNCCSIADKHKIPREADGFTDSVEVEKPEIIANQENIAGENADAKAEEQMQNGGPDVTEEHDEEGFGHDVVMAVSETMQIDDELTTWGQKLMETTEDGAPAKVITDALNYVDSNGDGQISAEEAAAAGITRDTFQEMDQDENGSIDSAEFIQAVQESLDQELGELTPEAVDKSDEGFEAPEVQVTETEATNEEGEVETAFGQAVDEAEADGTADTIVQDELETEQELQDEEDMADEIAAEANADEEENSEEEAPEDESAEEESPEVDDAEEE